MPVYHVRHDRTVYLQYRYGGADGAHRAGDGEIHGRVAVSVCDDGGDGRFRGIYDAGVVTGEHAGSGAGELPVQRFCEAGGAVHRAGDAGMRGVDTGFIPVLA